MPTSYLCPHASEEKVESLQWPLSVLGFSCKGTLLLCSFSTDLGSSSCMGLIARPSQVTSYTWCSHITKVFTWVFGENHSTDLSRPRLGWSWAPLLLFLSRSWGSHPGSGSGICPMCSEGWVGDKWVQLRHVSGLLHAELVCKWSILLTSKEIDGY